MGNEEKEDKYILNDYISANPKSVYEIDDHEIIFSKIQVIDTEDFDYLYPNTSGKYIIQLNVSLKNEYSQLSFGLLTNPTFMFSDKRKFEGKVLPKNTDIDTEESNINKKDFSILAQIPVKTLILANELIILFSIQIKGDVVKFAIRSLNNWISSTGNSYCKDVKNYAKNFKKKRDYDIYPSLFMKSALMGDAESQYEVADYYKSGVGKSEKNEIAFKFYLCSANQHYKKSYLSLSECYYLGIGTEKDENESLVWMKRAIKSCNLTRAEEKNVIAKYLTWFPAMDIVQIENICKTFIKSKNMFCYYDLRKNLLSTLNLLNKLVFISYDTSLFSLGKSGYAIAADGLYYRENAGSQLIYVSFPELIDAFIHNEISTDDYHIMIKGKCVFWGNKNNHQEYINLLKEISLARCVKPSVPKNISIFSGISPDTVIFNFIEISETKNETILKGVILKGDLKLKCHICLEISKIGKIIYNINIKKAGHLIGGGKEILISPKLSSEHVNLLKENELSILKFFYV